MKTHQIISEIEREHIRSLVKKGLRIDGRSLDDFREIQIKTGVVEKAEGSAEVQLGNTKVLAGIKAEIGPPFSDTPNNAVVTVNIEFIPLASPLFESGPPGEAAIEIARVIDRGIRETKAIDLKSLCIIPGDKVWVIFVDIYILDHDGNLFDASSIGALAALLTTKIKKTNVQNGEVELLDELQPLSIATKPISTTFAKIRDELLIDPSLIEESVADARLTITHDSDGNLCAMQKGGKGSFTLESILKAVDIARMKSEEIREKI